MSAVRYAVANHRVHVDGKPVTFRPSPNTSGREIRPRWLVEHYTAGGAEAVDVLCNRAHRASAHLVVERDARVTQLLPLNVEGWHAGASAWDGVQGLNRHSIGIEIVNFGELHRHPERGWMRYWRMGDGSWKWIGPVVPDVDVVEDGARTVLGARLRHGWHAYTAVQVERVAAISAAIVDAYGLEDVLGHAQISPGRKIDPGPAFPLAAVRTFALEGGVRASWGLGPPPLKPVPPLKEQAPRFNLTGLQHSVRSARG